MNSKQKPRPSQWSATEHEKTTKSLQEDYKLRFKVRTWIKKNPVTLWNVDFCRLKLRLFSEEHIWRRDNDVCVTGTAPSISK